jgi:hypothetical protein
MFGHLARLTPTSGRWNMTLFYSQHDRSNGSDGSFSVGHVLRRMRTALKKLHRAIAAAKIRRLRNELLLHAATRANRARPQRPDAETHDNRFPRQPLHLGEKWDF